MGWVPIDCPFCGRKVKDAPERSNIKSNVTCPGCRTRLRIEWDWKTKHASVGKA